MANKNSTLNKAKKDNKDEFYTRYEDVSRELVHYADQMRGKRIICPCDWDESLDEVLVYASEEYVAGNSLFSPGGTVKIIDHAHINSHIVADISEVKCSFVKFLVAHAEAYDIASIAVSGYNPETGEGVRFQDIDYSKYDLVITNPPFSQFREFIDVMFDNKLEFLIIGNQNAIKYANVFPRIMHDEMWIGYGFPRNCAHFINPFYEDTASDADHREGMIRVSGVMWFTNLDVDKRHEDQILTEEYNPDRYPKYDDYDAIEVSKGKEIPYDYEGIMGVPITWLPKYNPAQFEIVGVANHGSDHEFDLFKPSIDGKEIYARILIRNRKPFTDKESNE